MLVFGLAFSTPAFASKASGEPKNFQSPKPGKWKMTASVQPPGSKQVMKTESFQCIEKGDSYTKILSSDMSENDCTTKVLKDTKTSTQIQITCGKTSLTVDATRINDGEYHYNVDSSLAKITTVGTYAGSKCTKDDEGLVRQPENACANCEFAADMIRAQCANLPKKSQPDCQKSAATIVEQCKKQCK
jgi:hypothetical protein